MWGLNGIDNLGKRLRKNYEVLNGLVTPFIRGIQLTGGSVTKESPSCWYKMDNVFLSFRRFKAGPMLFCLHLVFS